MIVDQQGETIIYKKIMLIAIMLAVISSCSVYQTVAPSHNTATITIKMGCCIQGFICTDYRTAKGGSKYCSNADGGYSDGINLFRDTIVTVPKGNEIYLYFMNPSQAADVVGPDRKADFICNRDTAFDYLTPLYKE